MIEANPLKYYIARYFFLTLGVLQWIISFTLYWQYPSTLKNQFAALLFFTLGALLLLLFFLIRKRLRRVAVSKKKIVVIGNGNKQRIEWSEVRSLKQVPFINMYRLKLNSKKKGIYFFPSKNVEPIYGFVDVSKIGKRIKTK